VDNFRIKSNSGQSVIVDEYGKECDPKVVKLGEEIKDGMSRYIGLQNQLQVVYTEARSLNGRVRVAEARIAKTEAKAAAKKPFERFFYLGRRKIAEIKLRAQLGKDRASMRDCFSKASDLSRRMSDGLELMHIKEEIIADFLGRDNSSREKDGYFVDTQLNIHDFRFEAVFSREIAAT
jgi:hypothetical protein